MRTHAIVSLALAIAAASAAGQSAQPISFGKFVFSSSAGATVAADSATLTVPKNRLHLKRGTLSIPLMRFPATSSASGSPVIYVSGGTGSGIAAARGARFEMFLALRGVGDVITFDLRGAGKSNPRVDCGPPRFPDISVPSAYAEIAEYFRKDAMRCADSLRRAGVDPSGHNIREVVEDIDAIRRGVGARKINLVGISTGSQIVLEYLRRHPESVDRIIAAGVQAPNQNLHLPAGEDLVVQTLDELTGAAQPGVAAMLRRVLDTLSASPKTVTVKSGNNDIRVGLGPLDAQLVVSGTLGDRRQMALLPRLFGAALKGNYAPLASAKIAGARGGITSAYEALMDCQTGAPAEREIRRKREAKTALLGIATLDFPEQCSGWGVTRLDDSYRAPVRSNVAVLLISGTLDGRTPVRNASDALALLPNGSHLIIEGASHGDDLFLSAPQIVPMMVAYLNHSAAGRHLYLKAQ